MKATIVKNNDFETIGFELKQGEKTLFSWGIAPIVQLYFIKEVDVKNWASEIVEIIELSGVISEQKEFSRMFFDIIEDSRKIQNGESFNLSSIKNLIDKNVQKMENIIKNIL